MKRLSTVLGMVGLVCALATASAQAASATGARQGRIHGIVFAHGASPFRTKSNPLTYHGGPVMDTNSVYAIYWIPNGYSVDTSGAGYQQTIDNYFKNVGHDSLSVTSPPLQTNVYWSDTQYTGQSGENIQYNSTFAGEIDDSSAYPASGCNDRYTSVCLTDSQLQNEITHLITTRGLPTGDGVEYFLFTPKNVGSCFGSSCAYSYFCAYHSNFTAPDGSDVLYANMPYANWVSSACGTGQKPNGNDADSTINVTSHEHNESITDPDGTAWYDSSGNENGDKCAWKFGTVSGTSGSEYNQTINGSHYYLQQEWSNHSSGCVLQGL